jgi:hypothetical protein
MVRETFASLRDALAADSPEDVRAAMERLDDEMAVQRAREEGYVKQARAARGSRDTSEEASSSALALQQQVSQVTAARGRIFTAVDGYLTGSSSGREAADVVDSQLAAFDELAAAAESFDEAASAENLPAVLVVTGLETLAVPKGMSVEETVTVRNPGGSDLADVSLSVESEPEVDLSLSRTAFDAVAAGESATATLSGTPRRDSDVLVSASGGGLADSIEFTLNVRDAREIIGEAITEVYELLKRLRAALSDASGGKGGKGGKGGPGRSFEAKLEAVTKSLAKAFDRIEDGDPEGAVDGKLDAAIEQAEAFVNEVEAQSGKRLPERAASDLAVDARTLVAVIEEAKAAER